MVWYSMNTSPASPSRQKLPLTHEINVQILQKFLMDVNDIQNIN